MLKDLQDFLQLRSEEVALGPLTLVVKELSSAAQLIGEALPQDATEEQRNQHQELMSWKLLVRCTFDKDGKPVFNDSDIPALMESSRWKLAPLVAAVNRVNGFVVEDEAKKSEVATG